MMKAYLQVSESLLRGEYDLVRVRLNGEVSEIALPTFRFQRSSGGAASRRAGR